MQVKSCAKSSGFFSVAKKSCVVQVCRAYHVPRRPVWVARDKV